MACDQRIERILDELKQITGIELGIKTDSQKDMGFATEQLERLCIAYREKYDKNHFIKTLFFKEYSEYEISIQAEKLHIDSNENRVLFLLETQNQIEDLLMIVLKHMFPDHSGTYMIQVSETRLVILQSISRKKNMKEYILQVAHSIIDTLNAELLVSVKIVCGPQIDSLSELKKAFSDAEHAMKVGKLFNCEQNILFYDQVGVGRLICELPIDECNCFLNEVFRNDVPNLLDTELVSTMNRFFKNNFNIAETARQLHMHRNTLIYRLEQIEERTGLDLRKFEDAMTFKIALMVMNYINAGLKEF